MDGQVLDVCHRVSFFPAAELRPLRTRTFVDRATVARAAAGAPTIDLVPFRADVDAVVDPDVHDR